MSVETPVGKTLACSMLSFYLSDQQFKGIFSINDYAEEASGILRGEHSYIPHVHQPFIYFNLFYLCFIISLFLKLFYLLF